MTKQASDAETMAGPNPGQVSLSGLVLACLLGWGLVLGGLIGTRGWAGGMLTLLTDGPLALMIFLAAAGWGWLALRWVMPRGTPGALAAVTYCLGGLWLLSSALLTVGSGIQGGLSPAVWWPVLAVGLVALIVPLSRTLPAVRWPEQLVGTHVFWLAAAVAAAFWIAGALIPPGLVGNATGDFYDVVSYHLQVPAEHYRAGRIGPLPHNTYSYYPMGGQMLFLLGMILKGGVYEGVFVAKLTHGLWGVLAVLAVYHGLAGEGTWRRLTAAVLLATVPWVIYLSWLAFVELTELAYLAVGLAWLWRWSRQPCWQAALLVGLGAGGALATKYLTLGLVTGPLLAVMALAALRKPSQLVHVVLATVVAVSLMVPWLVRNEAAVGNPVFPLATELLGRGHWSAESAAMWDAGHAPRAWDEKPQALGKALYPEAYGLSDASFGLLSLLLTAAAAVWVLARGRRSRDVDWTCLGVLGLQLAVWALATHMAGRFLVPAAVPMVILIGGFTGWLTRFESAPGPSSTVQNPVPTGFVVAALLVLATAGMNLAVAWDLYGRTGWRAADEAGRLIRLRLHGWGIPEVNQLPGMQEVADALGADPLVLPVGDVRPFISPFPVAYHSVWEPGPLVELARTTDEPAEILRQLRARGITHLLVHWPEIRRLHSTYGWWPEIDENLITRLQAAGLQQAWANPDASVVVYALPGVPVPQTQPAE